MDYELALSIFLITLVSSLSSLLRRQLILLNMTTGFSRLFLEFISTLEASVFALEFNYIIWDNYTGWVSLSFLYLFSIYQTFLINSSQKVDANPVGTFRSWLLEEITASRTILVMVVQVAGACTAYIIIVKPIWSISSTSGHAHFDKMHSFRWVTSVFQEDPRVSAMAESIVTCVTYLVAVYTQDQRLGRDVQRLMTIYINTLVVYAGIPFSGGFNNPAIASALELGLTSGVSNLTKVWVYWVAPLFGITLGLKLNEILS